MMVACVRGWCGQSDDSHPCDERHASRACPHPDGDGKLIIADLDRKLRVYKGVCVCFLQECHHSARVRMMIMIVAMFLAWWGCRSISGLHKCAAERACGGSCFLHGLQHPQTPLHSCGRWFFHFRVPESARLQQIHPAPRRGL